MARAARVIAHGAGARRTGWLAGPVRWAGLGRGRARLVLALVALAVAAAALAGGRIAPTDPIDGAPDAALVDAVRHGGDYYAVAGDGARSLELPVDVRTVPLPTLFVIQAQVPAPVASAAMMLLAVAVLVAWHARFGAALPARRARIAALLLMLAGVAVTLRLPLVAVPEGWTGLLIALALARRSSGDARWSGAVEPAALGLAAAVLAPATLVCAAVMALFAWRERAWREALAWAAVLAVGLAIVALHAGALANAPPGPAADMAVATVGPGAAGAALAWATGLRPLPLALGVPLVVLATLGWLARRSPSDLRVAALIVADAAAIVVLDAPAAALIVAPLVPLGLLALPDAVRGLFAAALDRRRITVTRMVR